MSRKNMWSIYRKWMIIAILSGCVCVIGYSDRTDKAMASAPCIQECESNQNECNDYCNEDCIQDSTNEACQSCLQACSQTYFQCLSYAVSCQWLDVTPGVCQVEYGSHCPLDPNGQPNCADPSAFNAYFLVCDMSIGTGQCVSCPYYRHCSGLNGQGDYLPPCNHLF